MKNVLIVPSIVAGSKNGGGAGGITNYDDLTNKPKVNGIVLSGNKTSADLGITTLTPFPSTWPTTGKFEDLLAAIRADTIAVKGASFLGEVTFDDLPANLGNAEIKVEILEGTTSATKVIHSVITSGNREPYRWEYTSWNSGNSNSGWISFQLPLTAGDGISIENNVISATGGADVPEDVYTQRNLLAGKGIEIVNEPVEGGIDEHTLACWHFDGNSNNEVSSSPFLEYSNSAEYGDIANKFNGYATTILVKTIQPVSVKALTIDFWVKITTTFSPFVLTDYLPLDYKLKFVSPKLNLENKSGSQTLIEAKKEINVNEWHHLALVYTLSGVNYFIDGELQGTHEYSLSDITIVSNKDIMQMKTYGKIDELRISDIARPLNPDGKFPVSTKPYSLAIPTGNKVINNTITKTSQLTNDSGFITDVPVATTTIAGTVKPDGTSIAIDETGTISTVNTVHSTTITNIVKLTQVEYDALTTKDETTLYYIIG